MSSPQKPRVLCVDDEPNVVEGIALNLRRRFEVAIALSGEEGLACLKAAPYAVVISDMRMPGMDGAQFLARARALTPDTVRVLLTGHADFQAAISAVNEGQLFRFLTKPCPAGVILNTVLAAAEQYRLVNAERELLEKTLAGSVNALADVLALASPAAFGRGARLKRTVVSMCEHLGVKDRWSIEVAAQLSQIGCITLPAPVAEKLYFGQGMTEPDQAMADRAPLLADQVLSQIPRLEPVREILSSQGLSFERGGDPKGPVGTGIPLGARMLRLAVDYDTLQNQNLTGTEAIASLQKRKGLYDPHLLEALEEIVAREAEAEIREVAVADLQPGMVLVADVFSRSGLLLVARGHTVSPGLVERLGNFQDRIRDPIRVVLPRSQTGVP